jgi:hypothetical protein
MFWRFPSYAYVIALAQTATAVQMRFVPIFLAVTIFLVSGVRAESEMTAKLGEAQAEQLHEAVCSEPAHTIKRDRLDIWVCDHPRAYPNGADPVFCPVNRLNFSFLGDGLFQIFFGKFTANWPQAIATYSAFCESHANSFGGMALFNVVDQKFELVRYFPGIPAVDCVVPPLQGGRRQTAYCYGSFAAHGTLVEIFGPIRFKPNGEATLDTWFQAGNDDGHVAAMTGCKTNKPKPHHISAVRLDEAKSEIVLDVAVLDPRSVASACDRFWKGDFDETETDLQKTSVLVKGMAFIRPDELKFVTMVVRFRPPNAKAKVELTSEPAEP